MADDEQRRRIMREMLLQPERAFEVEIVGRLVEQQQVGLREQRRGERDAHAPAAGKFRAGPLLVGGGEAEPGEDRGRAGRGRMRADVGEPGLDLGDAMRVVRCFRFRQKRRALAMRLQHDLDQAAPGRPGLPAPAVRCASAAGSRRGLARPRYRRR